MRMSTNTENNHITLAISVVLALLAAGAIYLLQGATPISAPSQEEVAQTYRSTTYGLSFGYPQGFYLKENLNAGTTERPHLALVLVEDTEENRMVLNGETVEPREGPTAITIEVYPNPSNLSPEEWVKEETNWTVRTSDLAPARAGGVPATTFSWSGLYEGRSTVATAYGKAYVFSVTWLEPSDPLIGEYVQILKRVELRP